MILVEVYEARIDWFGTILPVDVFETEGSPLLGMTMMRGCRLHVDIVPDGSVKLELLQ